MAGSIKWMLYTLDSGETVAKRVDESNGEALGFVNYTGAASVTADPAEVAALREMRYVYAVNTQDTTQRKKFWVGKPDFTAYIVGGTFTIDTITWAVTGTVGEKKTFPIEGDTGLVDGDQP